MPSGRFNTLLALSLLLASACAQTRGYRWHHAVVEGAHQIALTAPAEGMWSSSATTQFQVTPAQANATALLGRVEQQGRTLVFTPQFPLMAGQNYRATYTFGTGGPQPLIWLVRIPSGAAPAPRVSAIHPSGREVPANHLKFYIHFSEPMQQGDLLRHVRLLAEDGAEVAEPFRETELWSADGRRLTLWFHPGRQKSGVNLNVELGPVLTPGKSYRLELSRHWASTAGTELGQSFGKTIRAGPPDRTQPDVARWKVSAPPKGTRQPLELLLDEPLDWALLHSQLTVESADGQPVAGDIRVREGERRWAFEPAQPWREGSYRVVVGSVLEDLAGNNLERLFEVDLQNPASRAGNASPRFVPFIVGR